MATAAITPEERKEIKIKTAKPMLWLAIGSMIIFFGGLTSAYIVSSSDASSWLDFQIPSGFQYSTVLILISSLTMMFASFSARNDKPVGVQVGVLLTLLLGFGFTYFQFVGWAELVEQGIFLADKTSASGSYIYFITGAHLAHLFAGLIVLIVTLINALMNKYKSNDYLGLQLSGIYWHFLDVLWVYLLLFLVFIR